MKNLSIFLSILALSMGAVAAPGPFFGTEITWGWPGLTFGYDTGTLLGYGIKYEPLRLGGWWGLGAEGRWRVLEVWPNFKFGLGVRFALRWDENGGNWYIGSTYWGPTATLYWDWGPYVLYLRGSGVVWPVSATQPLLGFSLSIGAHVDLGFIYQTILLPAFSKG